MEIALPLLGPFIDRSRSVCEGACSSCSCGDARWRKALHRGLFRVSQEFASGWLSMPPNGGIKQSIRGHKIQWQMSVRDSNTVVGWMWLDGDDADGLRSHLLVTTYDNSRNVSN